MNVDIKRLITALVVMALFLIITMALMS